ncbi:MAG TPA: RluA family pseudouridine synthase [Crinalium sp.]
MVMLYPLSDFIQDTSVIPDESPQYWYEGRCPRSGEWLRLPRTAWVEAIARGLMQQLSDSKRYASEGKMYGVLLVETASGAQRVLKAFSGLLNGHRVVEGWVPPIPGHDQVALDEARTLSQLDAIKQELIALQQYPERQHYESLHQSFAARLEELTHQHSQRKQKRQIQRQQFLDTLSGEALTIALEQLNDQSRRDGIERRHLKRQRDTALHPLKQAIEHADQRIQALKKQRKALSQELQNQMYAAYRLTNFAGESLSLQQLMIDSTLPTGTGDCCAPKLLHYAATHELKPLAMAEFWWGPPSTNGDKSQGEFYGACAERCQPLMGFLLSGQRSLLLERSDEPQSSSVEQAIAIYPVAHPTNLENQKTSTITSKTNSISSLPVLYKDEWLIAIDKPAGLLSVPGRYRDRQDSVLNRLRQALPDGMTIIPVHRLDQDTSGVLLLARDAHTYRSLAQQFQNRQVHKVYEALLSGTLTVDHGVIDLPLWGDPANRPYQMVDWQRGRPSITHFQTITREEHHTRVVLTPLTGRTHQLRVHAADPQGLGTSILGDRLYGGLNADRLYLHARELKFDHPQLGRSLHLQTPTPF